MRLSVNEYASLIRVAAIGAGLPVGVADELAAAALWQAGRGGAKAPDLWLRRPAMQIIAALAAADRNQTTGGKTGNGQTAGGKTTGQTAGQTGNGQAGDDLTLALAASRRELPDLPDGIEIDDTTRTRLLALAARTRVPASEASRIAGAGAGLTDND